MLVSEFMKGGESVFLLPMTPLWGKNVESMTSLELQAFVRMHAGTQYYKQALKEVEWLVEEVWSHSTENLLSPPSLVYFDVPAQHLTVAELGEQLIRVSMQRRKALLFALEMDMAVRDVANLTWKSMRDFSLTPLATSIVQTNPRHIRLNYVFWEPIYHLTAAPLMKLERSAQEVAGGQGFDSLRRLYKKLVLIDSDSDSEEFMSNLCAEHHQRRLPKH